MDHNNSLITIKHQFIETTLLLVNMQINKSNASKLDLMKKKSYFLVVKHKYTYTSTQSFAFVMRVVMLHIL